jgi:hypothetical protein
MTEAARYATGHSGIVPRGAMMALDPITMDPQGRRVGQEQHSHIHT